MTKQKRQLVGPVTTPPAQKYNPKVPCGARTRSGAPCTRPALPGKTRCKLHGGASTGPKTPHEPFNQRAAKAKLYSQILFEHEHDWVHLMRSEDGGMSLMTELEILRVQYLRAAVAQKKWLAARDQLRSVSNDLLEAEMRRLGVWDDYELHHHEGVKLLEWMAKSAKEGEDPAIPFEDLKIVRRQRHYGEELRQFAKAIDRMMRTQLEIIGAGKDEDAVAKLADDLHQFYKNADALMPGGTMSTAEDEEVADELDE